MLDLEVAKRSILPLKRQPFLSSSHCIFVDDLLVFCHGDSSTATNLDKLFVNLGYFTSLHINKDKSRLFCSKGCQSPRLLSQKLKVPLGRFPIKYLGLPLSVVYPKARDFAPLVNKCRRAMEGWATKLLSMAGRAELIRTVIHNIIS